MGPVEAFKSCVVNGQKVELFRLDDTIRYRLSSIRTGEIREGNFPIPVDKTILDYVAHLKLCDLLVKKQGAPNPLIPSHQWISKNRRVHLHLVRDNGVMKFLCQRINAKTNEIKQDTYRDLGKFLIPSCRCSAETRAKIEEIKTKSLAELNTFLKDFKMSCFIDANLEQPDVAYLQKDADLKIKAAEIKSNSIKTGLVTLGLGVATAVAPVIAPLTVPLMAGGATKLSLNTYKAKKTATHITTNHTLNERRYNQRMAALKAEKVPFLIEIEPLSRPSRIDSRVRVSKSTWAVTLIASGYSVGYHAEIIVEGLNNGKLPDKKIHRWGVKEGEYFIHKSGLMSGIKIHSRLFDHGGKHHLEKKLEYNRRTEVWKVTSETALKLLADIKAQKDKIKTDRDNEVEFALLGPSKGAPNAHNCFTWAREKLKEAEIVDLGTKTAFGLGILEGRTNNYCEYGGTAYSLTSFTPDVLLKNLTDEYRCSESAIEAQESI